MKIYFYLLMFVFGVGAMVGRAKELAPDTTTETKAQRDARMGWWREARFGMFIHWGLYAVPAGVWKGEDESGLGEWIMRNKNIPVADYKELAKQFDPTKFDADAWVSLAKSAGVKYIVITAKHHDGFAMFKSKADPFNIYDATPFKRDPLKELAAACKKYGIKLGFYYSQDQDWTAPGGASLFGPHWDKAQDGDFAEYLKKKAIPQMEELLTNYQPYPAVIWFDTPTGEMTPELASKIVALLNKHPNIIWNNRLGGGYKGDTETPEQTIPANGFPGRDWETCMTMNNTWGFKTKDTDFKSTETLLHNLIDIASSGGNYLLNVGPTPQGEIPAPEAERLRAMGQWLKVNGDAIYGTTATPFHRKPSWGRITQRPGKLYLSVFNWPADGKISVPISNDVTSAYLLAQPKTKFTTTSGPTGVTVNVTGNALDPIATVVVLKIKGKPMVIDIPLSQAADGTILLNADDAKTEGNLMVENSPSDIGGWTNENDYVHWTIRVTKPGKFNVSLNYSLENSSQGSTLTLSAGDQSLTIPVAATANWGDYKKIDAGTITVDKAGSTEFVLKGKKANGQAVVNLRDLTLTPAP